MRITFVGTRKNADRTERELYEMDVLLRGLGFRRAFLDLGMHRGPLLAYLMWLNWRLTLFVGVLFPAVALLIILMVMMVVKGAAVVMFFMHLRGDANVFKFLFIAPLLMATSMLIAFLALFSGHVGIGG